MAHAFCQLNCHDSDFLGKLSLELQAGCLVKLGKILGSNIGHDLVYVGNSFKSWMLKLSLSSQGNLEQQP